MSLNEYKTDLSYEIINTAKTGTMQSWDEKP